MNDEKYHHDPAIASLKISWKMLDNAILYVEQLFGIRLDREERTTRIVCNEHNAFTNCPIAKFLKNKGHKNFRIVDENNKTEYMWDESYWVESEFYGANQDIHSENFEREFGAIYRGDISPIQDHNKLSTVIDIQKNTEENILHLSDNINAHIPAIIKLGDNADVIGNSTKELTKAVKELTRLVKKLSV